MSYVRNYFMRSSRLLGEPVPVINNGATADENSKDA
jgi:hypothetical protein